MVCFTSDHDTPISQLPPEQVRLVVDAWADRTERLGELPHVEQVFCFENRGEEIGVTLGHPHGQIYAYPFVTPRTKQLLEAARRHRERTWRSLFADVWPASWPTAPGSSTRASTGSRSSRPRPAGRWRCTSTRAGRCPTSRP